MSKSFWIKLGMFILPFALGFCLLTGVLVYSGESMPLETVAAMQREAPTLFRPRYGSRDLQFKALSASLRSAPVLALGSSHVLQLRAELFTRAPDAFYNAGAPGWQLDQVEALLHQLEPGALPDILLLGLDHPWFNAAYVGETIPAATSDFEDIFAVNRAYMQSALAGDALPLERALTRQQPDGTRALGLRAIRDGHGFRSDGSEQYGDFLVGRFLDPAAERQRHLDFLRDGREMYVRGNTVSAEALAQLERILAWCEQQNITVVTFLPPFAPTLYEAIQAGGQHGYIAQLPGLLTPLLARYGDVLFDFSDGRAFGSDEDFFDGWHGSERIYLRLMLTVIDAQPALFSAYADTDALRAIDASAPDTFRVFGG